MHPIEIEKVLESFRIIVDTREQNNARGKKRIEGLEVPTERATLSYGDYTWNIDLEGSPYHDISNTISPSCVIERKMSLDELSSNLTHGRKRFQREFERARNNNATVYLLVEDATWESIIFHRYNTKFNSNAFISSLVAWITRYNLIPIFCKRSTSSKIIREILYRDIKERLVDM